MSDSYLRFSVTHDTKQNTAKFKPIQAKQTVSNVRNILSAVTNDKVSQFVTEWARLGDTPIQELGTECSFGGVRTACTIRV